MAWWSKNASQQKLRSLKIYFSVILIYLQLNFPWIIENLSLINICKIWDWEELGTIAISDIRRQGHDSRRKQTLDIFKLKWNF